MRRYSPALLCCMLVCGSLAEAREWRTNWNEVAAQGDLVRQLGGSVQIKTETGKRVTLPLANLCREDQLFVQQQTLARIGKPPREPRITAKVSWETPQAQGDKSPAEPVLVVTLSARGRDLANASRAGDVLIDELETDPSSPLKLLAQPTGPGSMSVVDHDRQTPPPPPHGILFKLRFTAGDEPITQIRRLRGSFKIVTGDPQTITVKEPASVKDRVLDDPLLEDLGLKIVVNPTGPSANFLSFLEPKDATVYKLAVSGQNDRILRIVPTDADGNWHYPKTSGSFGSEQKYEHHYSFAPPGPKDVELRITLLTERREERVSFDLSDLKVPARKKPKK